MKHTGSLALLMVLSSQAYGQSAPRAASKPEPSKTEMKVTPLEIHADWSLPWEEISGIKLYQDELFIASDNSMDIGRYPWKLSESNQKRIDVNAGSGRNLVLGQPEDTKKKKKKKKTKKSQWEAITLDKAGNLFILRETKDSILRYSPQGEWKQTQALASFSGRTHKEKGYEGILLLKDSHILVALTKPAMLVEFGPKGQKALGVKASTILQNEDFATKTDTVYEALHAWKLGLESGCEFSDLALGKDAKVFALLKDCNRIIELPELAPDGEMIEAVQSWSLPASIPHPEGLESLGDEGFLVASDVRAIERNLFWLKPPQKAN